MAVVADRAFTALQGLGLPEGLADVADLIRDRLGQALAATELSKRARPR
jgi:hypothetical protein